MKHSLLQEAVDHGLEPPSLLEIEKNPDLKVLRPDPRFAALVAHAKDKAAHCSRKAKVKKYDRSNIRINELSRHI